MKKATTKTNKNKKSYQLYVIQVGDSDCFVNSNEMYDDLIRAIFFRTQKDAKQFLRDFVGKWYEDAVESIIRSQYKIRLVKLVND